MRPLTSSPEEVLWILYGPEPPMTYVIEAYDRTRPSSALYWFDAPEGQRRFGRSLALIPGDERSGLTVNAISPSLLWHLIREPAGTVVVQELNLIALFACLSTLVRPNRRVVSMVEGDILQVGRTGRARFKVVFRRLLVRMVDAFAANNPDASRYLRDELGVPSDRIVEGWWLSGLPTDLVPEPFEAPADGPVVISVGRLIPLKAHDQVIRAAARHRREVGPVTVWIVGEGPEGPALAELAAVEGMGDHVHLLGRRSHGELRWALDRAAVMAFPTRQDLVGRAAVEALSTGTPLLASRGAKALLHLVQDGVNSLVVSPDDVDDLARAMRDALEPTTLHRLTAGAEETARALTPDAGAEAIGRAIRCAHARG